MSVQINFATRTRTYRTDFAPSTLKVTRTAYRGNSAGIAHRKPSILRRSFLLPSRRPFDVESGPQPSLAQRSVYVLSGG
jgi:hypothetical protein